MGLVVVTRCLAAGLKLGSVDQHHDNDLIILNDIIAHHYCQDNNPDGTVLGSHQGRTHSHQTVGTAQASLVLI